MEQMLHSTGSVSSLSTQHKRHSPKIFPACWINVPFVERSLSLELVLQTYVGKQNGFQCFGLLEILVPESKSIGGASSPFWVLKLGVFLTATYAFHVAWGHRLAVTLSCHRVLPRINFALASSCSSFNLISHRRYRRFGGVHDSTRGEHSLLVVSARLH